MMRTKEKADEADQKTVAAVERALSILNAFGERDRFLSLAELSERTGLYKSTILRLIQTLRGEGFLEQSGDGLYHIGPTLFRLARRYQDAVTPAEVILPVLRKLVDATSESAGFQIRAGNKRMCLYRVDSPQRLRDHVSPGDLLPLHLGAAGKIILAFSNPDDSRFEPIRRGVVVHTIGETAKGMAGLASPVFGNEGFVGALTLSGPEVRFDDAAVARFRRLLFKTSSELSHRLGGDISIF